MKFAFQNAEELLPGIRALAPTLHMELGEGGYTVCAHAQDMPTLRVCLADNRADIYYQEKCQFFRALGLLLEHIGYGEEAFDITEKPQFTMNGPMFDVSQSNAAFNTEALKEVIRRLALMGLNMLMLYGEDTYEVKAQPFYGYMRAQYTEEELRYLDGYAYDLGIEMIPCIQTLAHMTDPLHWSVYNGIRDSADCLMVGKEETYRYVEDIITAASKPFRTKKIHIGMDEALWLGTGNYLFENGYRDPNSMMLEHLGRVNAIVQKLGLEPMMWDDMFFYEKAGSFKHKDTLPDQEILDQIPKNVHCVCWWYDEEPVEKFCRRFTLHKGLTGKLVYAGAVFSWNGFGLGMTHTLRSCNAALEACRRSGIKDVFLTTWGDNGTEYLNHGNMIGMQIYAENGYADAFDYEKFKKRFAFCTGACADDFYLLEDLDRVPGIERTDAHRYNSSRTLMWQDLLTGLGDKHYEGVDLRGHYTALEAQLAAARDRGGYFADLFELSRLVARTLARKGDMGLRLRAAYKAEDKALLCHMAEVELPELQACIKEQRAYHRTVWMAQYKPFGWDIMDMRYGGILIRIESAIEALRDYLEGRVQRIEEFEREQLLLGNKEGPIPYGLSTHRQIATPSRFC